MDYKQFSFFGKALTSCGLVLGFAGLANGASPLKTVPWNGHVGAASFTFDDAMEDQIENLTPILEEMSDVRVTFFLSNMGGGKSLHRNGAGFAKLAQMGNEIGNHTDNHLQLPDQDDATLKSEIIDFASEIETVMKENGANVNVTALATPFCANNDKVSSVINQRHFINRDGGWHGRNSWDEEPKWLSMASRIWNHSQTAAAELLGALDTAAFIGNFAGANPWDVQVKGPSWLVLLHHGVSDAGGMSIAPSDLKSAFQRALKNDLWTAPFSVVGAYYKAHFTLDTASAVANDDGSYKVSWTLPHPQMPKSIPLKVKLSEDFLKDITLKQDEKIVLVQNGKEIQADENNVYTIEFCELNATIQVKSAGSQTISKQIQNSLLRNNATAQYTVYDLKGKLLGTTNNFEIPESMPQGIYIIRSANTQMSPVIKVKR